MSLGRRELLQVATATAALAATNPALAQGKSPTQDDLLRFKPVGQLTILNFTDLHAQAHAALFPRALGQHWRRADKGLPPHLVGEKLLADFKGRARQCRGLCAGLDLTFESLAKTYGRIAVSTAWRR